MDKSDILWTKQCYFTEFYSSDFIHVLVNDFYGQPELICEHYQRGLQCSINIWNFSNARVKSQDIGLCVLLQVLSV